MLCRTWGAHFCRSCGRGLGDQKEPGRAGTRRRVQAGRSRQAGLAHGSGSGPGDAGRLRSECCTVYKTPSDDWPR